VGVVGGGRRRNAGGICRRFCVAPPLPFPASATRCSNSIILTGLRSVRKRGDSNDSLDAVVGNGKMRRLRQIPPLRCFLFLFVLLGLCSCSSEAEKRLQWNLKTTVKEYEEIGQHSPLWDESAKEALRLYAQWRAGMASEKALPPKIAEASQKAIAAGCKDPLVLYVYNRFVVDKAGKSDQELADAHKRVAGLFKATDYAYLRKFYGALRAGEAIYKVDGFRKVDPSEMMNDAAMALARAIKENNTPYGELFQAAKVFMSTFSKMNVIRGQGWETLEPLLQKKWGSSFQQELTSSCPVID
jgi:hypothetical protein